MATGFMAGFGQAVSQLPDIIQKDEVIQQNRIAAKKQEQLAARKATGDLISQYASAIETLPEEQVPLRTNILFSQIEQATGQKVNPAIAKIINSDPKSAAKAMSQLYGEQGGYTMEALGKVLGDPTVFAGVFDAFNRRNKAVEAAASFKAGLQGQTPGEVFQSAAGIDPSAPGFKEQLGMLRDVGQNVRQSNEFAATNPLAMAARRHGVNLQNASPEVLQFLQQDVQQQAGQTAQSEATGRAMGALVDPTVAAKTGASPFATVAETRSGLLNRIDREPIRLPTPAEEADLTAVRAVGTERMKEMKDASSAAEASDARLDQLQALLNAGQRTGLTAPAQKRVQQILGEITGQNYSSVTGATLFQQASDALSLSAQVAMKGNTSDGDRKWLTGQFVNLSNSTDANKAFVDMAKIMNQRVRDKEKLLSTFNRECGLDGRKCSVDFPEFYQTWMEQHSLQPQFEKVLKKYGVAPAPAAGTTPPQTGGATGSFGPALNPLAPAVQVPSAESETGAAFGVPPRGIQQRVR